MPTEKNYSWRTVDPDGQPWVRDVETSIRSLRNEINKNQQRIDGLNKTANSSISALPISKAANFTVTAGALIIPPVPTVVVPGENGDITYVGTTDGFADCCNLVIDTPMGKTKAVFSVQGNLSYFDATNAGATMEYRVRFSNAVSPILVASQTSISGITSHNGSIAYAAEVTELTPNTLVSLQARVSNADAFVSHSRNVASVSATVTYN